MEWIDYAIIAVIVLSVIISLIRGFVREALSLAVWVGAFFVASQFYDQLAVHFSRIEDEVIRNGVAVAILFITTIIVGALLTHLIWQLVQKSGLSGTDRFLGAVFGVLRGILLVCAALFFMDSFTGLSNEDWWQESDLIPHFAVYIEWFFDYLENSSTFLQENQP